MKVVSMADGLAEEMVEWMVFGRAEQLVYVVVASMVASKVAVMDRRWAEWLDSSLVVGMAAWWVVGTADGKELEKVEEMETLMAEYLVAQMEVM